MKLNKLLLFLILISLCGCNLVQKIPTDIPKPEKEKEEVIIEKEIIKIGAILPLNENSLFTGNNILNAIELKVTEINKSQYLDNTNILMFYENGDCNYEKAKESAIKLIDEYKVQAIIGGVCSKETLAISEVVKEKKIPVLSIYSLDPKIRNTSNYIFRLNSDDRIQSEILANFILNDLNIDNIFIAYEDSEYGKSFKDEFSKAFAKTISNSKSFVREQENFIDIINEYRLTPSKAIFLISMPNEAKNFLNQLNKENIESTIIATDTINDDSIKKIILNSNNKLFFSSPSINNDEKWQQFSHDFQLAYGKEPTIGCAEGYDAINILAKIIKEKGANLIYESLNNMEIYNGASGQILFDKNRENIKQRWNIYELSSQEMKIVKYL